MQGSDVMQEITVELRRDHLESMAKVKKPILGVAELIWNGLDADAEKVEVHLLRNGLSGLDVISVTDNGNGMPHDEAIQAFRGLGGSWKKGTGRTKKHNRFLHGKYGKGRFRAFALGTVVRWDTRYRENGCVCRYTIEGKREKLGSFLVGSPVRSNETRTGTTVEVVGIEKNFTTLDRDQAVPYLTEQFALYLMQYPDVLVLYDGERIDPATIHDRTRSYDFAVSVKDGDDETEVPIEMTLIEWKQQLGRGIYLCDENGFTLEQCKAGIHAPGYSFSVYLKSEYFRRLEEDGNVLVLEELDPFCDAALRKAKDLLRDHFRERTAEKAGHLVEEWKKQQVYPYEGEPTDIVARTERQVFDILALNLAEFSPTFGESDVRDKRITFELLRHAVESNPSLVRRILVKFLGLPEEKKEELAQLLERTSLEAIITASKVVADRLDFLRGLQVLLFDAKSRKDFLERRQLHRILAQATWLFGEQFNLTADDENLREVLVKHQALLGDDDKEFFDPVIREDGREGIVDLVLSRSVPMPDRNEHFHLVIELKRPKVPIGDKEISQINSYANAVCGDERFDSARTKWVFLAVSDELTDTARRMANQSNRPPGIVYDYEGGRVTVWAKEWNEIINECSARMAFFRERLECRVDRGTALEFLDATYAKYLPESVRCEIQKSREGHGEDGCSEGADGR